MRNNLENNSAMLKSAEPNEGSADSLIGNADSPSLEQLNYSVKEREIQRKILRKN